jgi:hypothetical protein
MLYDTLALVPRAVLDIFHIIDMNAAQIRRLEENAIILQHDLEHYQSIYEKFPEKAQALLMKINSLLTNSGIRLVDPDHLQQAIDNLKSGGVSDDHIKRIKRTIRDSIKKTEKAHAEVMTKLQNSGIPLEVTSPQSGGDVEREATKFDPYLARMKSYEEVPHDENHLANIDRDIAYDTYVNFAVTEITMQDRLIFIALTYIIRLVTLFIVEWSITTGMSKNFNDCFIQYITIYCLMIIFITFVVSTNSVGLQMLLYYMDTNTHGYSRLMLHLFLVTILLPILVVIQDPGLTTKYNANTYVFKQQILNNVSILTWVIWLFTSLIALRF